MTAVTPAPALTSPAAHQMHPGRLPEPHNRSTFDATLDNLPHAGANPGPSAAEDRAETPDKPQSGELLPARADVRPPSPDNAMLLGFSGPVWSAIAAGSRASAETMAAATRTTPSLQAGTRAETLSTGTLIEGARLTAERTFLLGPSHFDVWPRLGGADPQEALHSTPATTPTNNPLEGPSARSQHVAPWPHGAEDGGRVWGAVDAAADGTTPAAHSSSVGAAFVSVASSMKAKIVLAQKSSGAFARLQTLAAGRPRGGRMLEAVGAAGRAAGQFVATAKPSVGGAPVADDGPTGRGSHDAQVQAGGLGVDPSTPVVVGGPTEPARLNSPSLSDSVLHASELPMTTKPVASRVREIDIDLSQGGAEDVSMTMRLIGDGLSVVIRAANSQTAGAIEAARDAITERLAAIGQPLESLTVQQTGSTTDGTTTKDGPNDGIGEKQSGQRNDPSDPRGARRGAPGF